MSASAGRKARVEQAMRDILSEMIARDVKDPRVKAAGLVSVSKVECNPDLSVANVYISIYGATDAVADKAVVGLQGAAGFLRGPVGRALHLAHPPELRFHRDIGPEMSQKLADIIREDREKAAAAGRGDREDDTTTTDREPTRVLDDEPTKDLHPAALASEDEP